MNEKRLIASSGESENYQYHSSSGVLHIDVFKAKEGDITCIYTLEYHMGKVTYDYSDRFFEEPDIKVISFSNETQADTFYAGVKAEIAFYKGGTTYKKIRSLETRVFERFNYLKQQFACR